MTAEALDNIKDPIKKQQAVLNIVARLKNGDEVYSTFSTCVPFTSHSGVTWSTVTAAQYDGTTLTLTP